MVIAHSVSLRAAHALAGLIIVGGYLFAALFDAVLAAFYRRERE